MVRSVAASFTLVCLLCGAVGCGGSDDGASPPNDDASADALASDATSDVADAKGDAFDAKTEVGVDAPMDAKKDAPIDTTPLDAGPSSARQIARPLGSTSAPNGFYEYLPPTYADGTPHPLLVFWHGVGEDGNGTSDLSKVIDHGPPLVISKDEWPADRPFIVLSPQHGPSGCPSATEIHDFISWAMGHYHVDDKRVYLTGLSCGAIGSWQYIDANLAAQISAAVLLSGDPGDPTQSWSAWGSRGCNLGQVAIWAFHGDMDTTVPIANEQTTMNDLLACPSPPRRETHWNVIVGGGHAIWDPIYDGSAGFDVYAFLLKNPHP